MKVKENQDLREKIKHSNFFAYEVAAKLGCHENTLFRLLRKKLTEEQKQTILDAINHLTLEVNCSKSLAPVKISNPTQ
ncbi:hypothetical protein G3A_07195 [Bacillus sp. 17376]|nr:hypothetical protein G3A_07195 [Bacillus sp. 17376]